MLRGLDCSPEHLADYVEAGGGEDDVVAVAVAVTVGENVADAGGAVEVVVDMPVWRGFETGIGWVPVLQRWRKSRATLARK
jgi:hypothetical protein